MLFSRAQGSEHVMWLDSFAGRKPYNALIPPFVRPEMWQRKREPTDNPPQTTEAAETRHISQRERERAIRPRQPANAKGSAPKAAP